MGRMVDLENQEIYSALSPAVPLAVDDLLKDVSKLTGEANGLPTGEYIKHCKDLGRIIAMHRVAYVFSGDDAEGQFRTTDSFLIWLDRTRFSSAARKVWSLHGEDLTLIPVNSFPAVFSELVGARPDKATGRDWAAAMASLSEYLPDKVTEELRQIVQKLPESPAPRRSLTLVCKGTFLTLLIMFQSAWNLIKRARAPIKCAWNLLTTSSKERLWARFEEWVSQQGQVVLGRYGKTEDFREAVTREWANRLKKAQRKRK